MKRKIFICGILGILLLGLLGLGHALSTPYLIVGKVYESDGSTIAVGASVTATNIRTGETLTDTVNSYGWYANIDAGNFPSGYLDGDTIQIYAEDGGDTGSVLVQIDTGVGGITAQQITLGGGGTTTTTTTQTTTTTTTTSMTTTTNAQGLSVNPTLLTITQQAGDKSTYYIYVTNQGTGTVVNVFISGIDNDWFDIEPINPYISKGESRAIQIKVEIPDDEDGTFNGNILCNAVSIPLTVKVEKEWFEVIDDDWLDEGESITFDDYEFTLTSVRSSYIKVDLLEDDDEIVDNKKCYDDDETELNSHFKVYVHKIDEDDEQARITLYSDEEDYEDISSSGSSGGYKYTLFENVQFSTGTWLNFEYGQFYLNINTVADTGARIDLYVQTNYPEIKSCFVNDDCKIGDNLLLTVKSITRSSQQMGSGSVVLDVKSKEQYMVYQTTTPFTSDGLQSPYDSSYSSSYSQTTSTQTSLYISIAGGKIAPNNKVIFYVRDYSNMPVRTGTLTIDLIEPLAVDISEGLATVRFPEYVECPILITATASGYQTTPQVFTSCSEEGSSGYWYSTSGGGGGANCSDGKKNCHDGDCEIGVDCGGSCKACKLAISTSPSSPQIGADVEVTVTSNSKGMEDVDVTIEKPDGTEKSYTTDSDGEITFEVAAQGTYKITAELEDYASATAKISTKEKTMTLKIDPSTPSVGETVYLTFSGTEGTVNPTSVTVNGLPITGNAFTVSQAGNYEIVGVLSGYKSLTKTIRVEGALQVLSAPEAFALNQANTIQLSRVSPWVITKDGIVIDSGTGSTIQFTPTEPGTYTVASGDTTLRTYAVSAGGNIWSTITLLLIVLAALFVILALRNRRASSTKGAETGLRDKKIVDETDEVMKKIAKGQGVDVDVYGG